MEWPTAVTPSARGAMLFQLYRDFCFEPVIGFTVTDRLTVQSHTVTHQPVCPLTPAGANPIPAFPTDTVIPLPALTSPYGLPAFFEVRAVLASPRGETFERTAGTIILASQADTMRQMAGSATILTDSSGCIVLRGGAFLTFFPGGGFPHEYAIQNPPVFSDTLYVLVRAHAVLGAKAAACGSRALAHLDYAETVLLP
jgi:hypothetical protein